MAELRLSLPAVWGERALPQLGLQQRLRCETSRRHASRAPVCLCYPKFQ
jgi:hypothetical protein